jgi:nitrogen fixation protein FixH
MTFELKGSHVLAALLAFFAITVAVNTVFTVYAISTFSGEHVSKPYVRGLEYNTTLAARTAQATLGWKAELALSRDGAGALVVLRIVDRNGKPLNDLDAEVVLRRPTNAALDKTITLDPVGGGEYRATVPEIATGQWDVVAYAKGASATFEAERRIVLE